MVATTVPRFVTRAPPPPPVGEAEEKEESAASPDRCQFWLPNKRRLCANTPLPSSGFCGNHNPDAGARRIPCPIDPSHSVSEDNLQSHVKKCPFRKQALALESQPYYSKGINGSPDDDYVDSAAKRNTILQLSVKDFQTLLEKVKSIHSAISVVLLDSYVIPDACSAWLKQQHLDRKLPYQEKHAMQQASIVGNIEATGILQKPNESTEPFYQEVEGRDHFGRDESQVPAVVEFGAGRGYLTQMLIDCYGLSKVCLIERKSYKLKADRSLRQSQNIILERLRIDIEDLNLKEVNLLKGLQYIAIGKHLCGPATDLTISCCLSGQGEENNKTHSTIPNLQGLALATCCHHLCQWKHYANTQFLLSLGITKEEFHAMTWFTSWAVDADHSSELADALFNATNISTIEEKQSDFLGGSVDDAIRSIPTLDRARLGFMCKEIIDIGRLFWLREHGMDAQLVKYVPLSISPENHLLIAKCCS